MAWSYFDMLDLHRELVKHELYSRAKGKIDEAKFKMLHYSLALKVEEEIDRRIKPTLLVY